MVIVGGVAAGASAAARARRLSEEAEIVLLERGPDVSFANCGLPYHIGGEITDRERLAVQTPESLRAMLNLDVRAGTEAVEIDREGKRIRVRRVTDGGEEWLDYDKLLLAPGASPVRPPIPGIGDRRVHTLRNLQDMDRIKQAAEGAEAVTVIGAGFIGLEMAEQLQRLGKRVTVVELQDQVLPQMDREMTGPVAGALREAGVELILGDGIEAFEPGAEGVGVRLASGKRWAADEVILSIGVRPESGLATQAGLETGPRGHIVVNEYQQTSDPDIYAAGDVTQTRDPVTGESTTAPLGGPANRQGRLVADHIFRPEGVRPYPGSLGTAIVRVFEVVAGMTGCPEKRLRAAGREIESTVVTDHHHAKYYPGACQLSLKLIWDKSDGRVLGAQATGYKGVDKRIDVLATAIRAGMTVADVADLELAYAPPFGAAKDIVNLAGMAACNIRDGLVRIRTGIPEDEDLQLVDLRPPAMAELSPVDRARSIPLPELRDRLGELDQQKPVATVCALGKLSYFGARILAQHGFDVTSVSGGIRVRRDFTAPAGDIPPDGHGHTSRPSTGGDEPAAGRPASEVVQLDACGLACPGPIMKVKEAVAKLAPGTVLEVRASDGGFATDLPAFCRAAGHEFLGAGREDGVVVGRLRAGRTGDAPATTPPGGADGAGATMVVFSQDMDKALAALVIANGALAMGGPATIFFTFWGLNVLRKDAPPPVAGKTFMDRMFGWMMPRGPRKLPLSNMHMAGMGTNLMKWRMASKNLPDLPGLLEEAKKNGARLVACSMSMEAMGLRREELIDGVEVGGVADFLGATSATRANLFI